MSSTFETLSARLQPMLLMIVQIRLRPLLSSRSRGCDEKVNPNRWWNTTGDWMRTAV